MNKAYTWAVLKNIVNGMSKLMGDNTEIVIHDIEEHKIVYIENGYITDRKVGDQIHHKIYEMIEERSDSSGHLIGYRSNSKAGFNLKSSHFIVRDDAGNPFALICINQDISNLVKLREELDGLINTNPLIEENNSVNPTDKNIQQITKKIIADEIELAKPFNLDLKESKMDVIRRLDLKGVFSVKDAVPQVCDMLSISQATLYNYQREIRLKDRDNSDSDIFLKMINEK